MTGRLLHHLVQPGIGSAPHAGQWHLLSLLDWARTPRRCRPAGTALGAASGLCQSELEQSGLGMVGPGPVLQDRGRPEGRTADGSWLRGRPLYCRQGEQAPGRVRQGQARGRDQQAGQTHGEPTGRPGSHGGQTSEAGAERVPRTATTDGPIKPSCVCRGMIFFFLLTHHMRALYHV